MRLNINIIFIVLLIIISLFILSNEKELFKADLPFNKSPHDLNKFYGQRIFTLSDFPRNHSCCPSEYSSVDGCLCLKTSRTI